MDNNSVNNGNCNGNVNGNNHHSEPVGNCKLLEQVIFIILILANCIIGS
jgi:hypothetical protein